MAIYEILIVGAAFSRDYAMIAIKRLLPEMRDNPYFRWFITDKR